MKTFMRNLLISTVMSSIMLSPAVFAAGGGANLQSSGVNVHDIASLQHGAKLFVNYCMSCHSAEFMRYQRLAEDLELTEEMVMQNLAFADAKIGDPMTIAMQYDDAEEWFGKAPPDLSLVGRSRGPDWIYSYMMSFYKDEFGGWNNTVLANAAMPHVMWQLQGIQEPVYRVEDHGGIETKVIDRLELTEPGLMTPEEYKGAMRDLAAFLTYVSEPAQLKRKQIGVWVMLYLAFFALLAYLLKAEFWRDVH